MCFLPILAEDGRPQASEEVPRPGYPKPRWNAAGDRGHRAGVRKTSRSALRAWAERGKYYNMIVPVEEIWLRVDFA